MSDKNRQERRRGERAQNHMPPAATGGTKLPPPPPSVAAGDPQATDSETMELILRLSQLGAIAISRAGEAIGRSQSMIPDFDDGPPKNIPTLAAAVQEQARAYRFAACSGHIDRAIQELKRPLEVPTEAES